MAFDIDEVRFPQAVEPKIAGRGITEDEVCEALTAAADLGEDGPLTIRRLTGTRGGDGFWVLCRVPGSGRYLSVGIEVMPTGLAWCYHAMDMTQTQRRQFGRRRR
jgi:hypothetical protein